MYGEVYKKIICLNYYQILKQRKHFLCIKKWNKAIQNTTRDYKKRHFS